MPTATYIALANYTVSSGGPTSVTFSSIPATYRDLVLVCNHGASSGTQYFSAQINSDTGTNYFMVTMSGSGSSVLSQNYNFGRVGSPIPTNTAGVNSNTIMHFMDYSATDKHKTILIRENDPSTNGVVAFASRWSNTNAVTSIKVFYEAAASFRTGSTFALYGIVS